jgi:hypothetical protein
MAAPNVEETKCQIPLSIHNNRLPACVVLETAMLHFALGTVVREGKVHLDVVTLTHTL